MHREGARDAALVLAQLAPRLGRLISSSLERDAHSPLSLRQYRILERLAERPYRTGELASESEVSQASVSTSVAALESRGLIRRTPDPADGRASLIVLTSQGRSALVRAHERLVDLLTLVTLEAEREDAAALSKMQARLNDGIDRARTWLRDPDSVDDTASA